MTPKPSANALGRIALTMKPVEYPSAKNQHFWLEGNGDVLADGLLEHGYTRVARAIADAARGVRHWHAVRTGNEPVHVRYPRGKVVAAWMLVIRALEEIQAAEGGAERPDVTWFVDWARVRLERAGLTGHQREVVPVEAVTILREADAEDTFSVNQSRYPYRYPRYERIAHTDYLVRFLTGPHRGDDAFVDRAWLRSDRPTVKHPNRRYVLGSGARFYTKGGR